MKIYPALDILDGRCVRLREGDFENKTIYSEDPGEIAAQFKALGAQYLHLVDLSGAKDPQKRQLGLIRKIVLKTHLKIQCGGGIRSLQEVTDLLELGADRVVLGSIALNNPALVLAILKQCGSSRITLALDLRITSDGSIKILSEGWQRTSNQDIFEWIDVYLKAGLRRVLCTDIGRDGMMSGPNIDLYQILVEKYPQIDFQASGGVSQLSDLQALKKIGVHSVIFGRAFYEGKIDIQEAMLLGNDEAMLLGDHEAMLQGEQQC